MLDTWNVKYAEDAYGLFSDIADKIYGIKKDTNVGRDNIRESYAWKIEVHRYSGFNGFFGVGSKMGTDANGLRIDVTKQKMLKIRCAMRLLHGKDGLEKEKKVFIL